jgi:hypothetical protein
MDQVMTFDAPQLPVGTYDAVILLAGVVVEGAGLVPLGLSAGTDSMTSDDVPDGLIEDPIELHVAEVAGSIPEGQFRRIVIALALELSGATNETGPRNHAVQVLFVDSFSGNHILDPFLLPAELAYDADNRLLAVTGLPAGADFHQAAFTDDASLSNWYVLGQLVAGDFTLPTPPAYGDRASTASFISADLIDGLNYQTLLEFNNTNLSDLIELVKAFSLTEIP